MAEESDAFDLDLAVSSLAADGNDNQLMMRLLCERLSGVLGDRMRIDRGGLLRKNNTIRRVEVRIGDTDLVAELGGAAPTFSIGLVSGGICIRTERTDAARWIRTLLEALRKEADHSRHPSSTRINRYRRSVMSQEPSELPADLPKDAAPGSKNSSTAFSPPTSPSMSFCW